MKILQLLEEKVIIVRYFIPNDLWAVQSSRDLLSISFPGGQDWQDLLKRGFLWYDSGSVGLENQAINDMLAKMSIILRKMKFKIFERILNSNFLRFFFFFFGQQTSYSVSGMLVLKCEDLEEKNQYLQCNIIQD